MEPVRLFIDKSSSLRDFSIPISWGIVPESPLLLSKRVDKFPKLPIEAGIEPVRLFLNKASSLRELNIPIS